MRILLILRQIKIAVLSALKCFWCRQIGLLWTWHLSNRADQDLIKLALLLIFKSLLCTLWPVSENYLFRQPRYRSLSRRFLKAVHSRRPKARCSLFFSDWPFCMDFLSGISSGTDKLNESDMMLWRSPSQTMSFTSLTQKDLKRPASTWRRSG